MESGLPQQPDFRLISQNYNVLSQQFSLMENLPAVGGAVQFQKTLEQVLEQIRLLGEKVNAIDRRLTVGLDGVNRRLTDGLDGVNKRLTDGLDGVNKRLTDGLDGVNKRLDGVNTTIATMESSINAGLKNATARQQNYSVIQANMPLCPMYDAQTGDLIEDFPYDLTELDAMELGQVDILLRRLGETPRGREDARRLQLGDAIGVLTRRQSVPTRERTGSQRQRQR